MTKPLILYYAPDNASLCVRLLLEVLELPFETRLVNRSKHAQRDASYLALNPNGLIPVLETSDGPIYETAAILLWLADRAQGAVFPAPDSPDRAAMLSDLFWLSNTLHPALRMLFYPQAYAQEAADAVRTATQQRIKQLLDTHADRLAAHAEAPVIACYLAPMLRWPALYGGDTAWFTLARWPSLLQFAKTFEVTHPTQRACMAEGLGPTPFSRPHLPNPPEGTAI